MDDIASLLRVALGLLILVLIIAALAVTIKFCIEDARRRGKSPVLVTLAAVFFFPWGLIAWLLFRPDPLPDDDRPPFRLKDHRIQ